MLPELDQFTLLAATPLSLFMVTAGVYLFSRDAARRTRAMHLLRLFLTMGIHDPNQTAGTARNTPRKKKETQVIDPL